MMIRLLKNTAAYLRLVSLGAKSRFKSFLGMALSALAAPVLIAAAFIAAGPLIAGAFSPPKLELVFCDLEGSAYFDTILNLLLADESITKTINVKKLGYDEALAELDSGGADAVVIFPEAFISDMSRGVNRPIKIMSGEADPVRTVFIKEFMQSAAAELSAAQSAINTVWFNMNHDNLSAGMRNLFFTTLTLEYTSKAFARSIYYSFIDVPPAYEGSSPAAFLTASALAAIVFFGSLAGVRQILGERRSGITTRLAASGVKGVRAALYHFIPIYIKQLLCACFAVIIAFPAVIAALPPNVSPAEMLSAAEAKQDESEQIIGSVISAALNRPADAPLASAGDENGDDGTGAAMGAQDESVNDFGGGSRFDIKYLAGIVKLAAAKENAPRLFNAFGVMAVLCLFTSSLALFAGYMLKRPESADALIVTLGIGMAVAGGTVIPYPFMPEVFQSIGPFCFNRHAQGLIASALFGNQAGGWGPALTAFTLLAALLLLASVVRINREYI